MDKDIDNIGDKTAIETLVIGCDLEDYSFIADMVNLTQLYIYSGKKLRNIEFVQNLVGLRQLYIVNSHVDSLESIERLLAAQKKIFDAETDWKKKLFCKMDAICIESDCDSLDGKRLQNQGLYLSEVILNQKSICEND